MEDILKLTNIKTTHDFQILDISIGGNGQLTPQDLKNARLPDGIDFTKGVVLNGKSPLWLYGHLVHLLHISKWVASFDPRLGAVVIQSHSADGPQLGDVIPMDKILPFLKQDQTDKKKL